jgi:hypothetical protein
MFPRHGWQNLVPNLPQKRSIAPGRVGNDVMQTLMHLTYVAGSQTCCHRLHALALNRQHEPFDVVLDGDHAIGISSRFCHTVQINLEPFPLTRKIQLANAHSFNVLPKQSTVPE